MNWKKYMVMLGTVALLFGAADAYARGVLYEDPETGQLFTKPGEGRVAVDAEMIINGGAVNNERPETTKTATADEEGISDKVLSKLPKWVQDTEMKGDLRVRYDFMDTENKETRHRGRYRARIFLKIPVTEKFNVHFLLASGSDDPKSGNVSFDSSFAVGPVEFRKAFVQYDATDWLLFRAGQMDNLLWTASDAVWDKDISPTGAGFGMNFKNDSIAEPFLNGAVYVIEETSSSPRDPYMFVVQPGVGLKISDNVHAKFAGTYYNYQDVKNSALANSPGSNTMSGGALLYDYDGLVGSASVDIKTPVAFLPYVGLFGEYAYNFDPDVLNDGYIAGVKLGHKKVRKGDWQLAYSWRRMGRDAVLDILPDSDAFSGRTNITGHEVIAKYGLLDNVELGLDYYNLRDITTNIDEHRVQTDLVFSFPAKK